ncbi:type VII secretion system-associated protein [Streptomyces canus]|uniref:type VII secretion system-associated protein n=1 Tax=Streptomyces canus TaxID=58343 RepID=UPI00036A80C1|nr:type VII secretion system-associated protein [Streptomyces canus]
MAGDKADVTHFNIKQMENFRDNEVQPVQNTATKYREDGDGGHIRSLAALIDGKTTPDNLGQDTQLLRLGRMGSEPLVSGPTLLESVRASATAVDKLLGDQITLFKDLQAALTETIDQAIKTKDENLSKIDAQTLLMNFQDIDALTSGGTGGTGGTGATT